MAQHGPILVKDISYRMAEIGTAQVVEIKQGKISEEELEETEKNHAWFIALLQ